MRKTTVQDVGVPLKFHIPDDIITRFASHMVVQTLENEFKVSFFETNPEIILDDQEPSKEVQANCVASIIINANKLPTFINALQRQLARYKT